MAILDFQSGQHNRLCRGSSSEYSHQVLFQLAQKKIEVNGKQRTDDNKRHKVMRIGQMSQPLSC